MLFSAVSGPSIFKCHFHVFTSCFGGKQNSFLSEWVFTNREHFFNVLMFKLGGETTNLWLVISVL